MEKLNGLSLDVEFLLISVVQAVALGALATAAVDPIGNLRFEYFPYIIASFVLILSFWSQAIIHAISFIDWPLNLTHSFLYFLASFIEVMAFSRVTVPLAWFGFVDLFFIIAVCLYFVDLKMIRARKSKFKNIQKVKLYKHMVSRQLFEMKILLPAAVIFCSISFIAILIDPNMFIAKHWHLLLIGLQTAFGIFVLWESTNSFKVRAKLVTQSKSS